MNDPATSDPGSEFESVVLRPTCRHVRHKLMYVDLRHAVRGMVDTESDTRVFWCAMTQDHFGPDGEPVEPQSCSRGDRACFCGR